MKKNIFALIVVLISTLCLYAQQPSDTTLTRQLELQREFNPTLQDANKINSLPKTREPQVKKANREYATWTTRATPPFEIRVPQPSNIMTDIPFNLQNGYLKLNAGNYANIDGALGYNFIDNATDRLGVMALHNSSNGNVDYNQDGALNKTKMKFMDNLVKLNFIHKFEATQLKISSSYLHSQFNYYGNNFREETTHKDNNQVLGIFNLTTSLNNTQPLPVNYIGAFSYNYFTTKYGRTLNDESLNGSQIEGSIDLNNSFLGGDNLLGVQGNFSGIFYDKISTLTEEEKISNFIMLDVNPYIHFEGYNWKMRLGANADFVFDDENSFYLSPNVAMSVLLTDNSSLFLNAKGGVENNTYLDMYKKSRYILPSTIVKHAYTPFSIDGGAKIGDADGFRFDLFGGYRKTKDEHFLILDSEYEFNNDSTEQIWMYREFLKPIYGELSHAHIGASLRSNVWSPLDVSFTFKKNFYTLNKVEGIAAPLELKAWNKPGIEANIDSRFTLMEDLSLTLGYYFANDRWSIIRGESIKMDDIHSINLGAFYSINEMFSVNLKANNLLNQSYDIWFGHPTQGVNIIGGFTLKF